MGRLIVVCLGCVLTLAAAVAQGDPQPIPSLSARVTDLTNTLDVNQRQTLESELAALERRKGSQIGVLIVPTTQPEDIAQYAIRVFAAWKLGRKGIDDGVLLIVAKDDHSVRIEVARGLEGAIPDAAAARIIREYIAPKFRAGDFYGGIEAATGTLTKLIDGEPLPPARKRSGGGLSASEVLVLTFFFINFPLSMGLFFAYMGFLSKVPRQPRYALCLTIIVAVGLLLVWWMGWLALISTAPGVGLFTLFTYLAGLEERGGSGAGSSGFSTGGDSDSGSSSESSDSSSSDSSFSGGGGESSGGGASGNW